MKMPQNPQRPVHALLARFYLTRYSIREVYGEQLGTLGVDNLSCFQVILYSYLHTQLSNA